MAREAGPEFDWQTVGLEELDWRAMACGAGPEFDWRTVVLAKFDIENLVESSTGKSSLPLEGTCVRTR